MKLAECYTCKLQICESCWGRGDHCRDDGQTHQVTSFLRRGRPSNCCTRLAQSAPSLCCDRYGCGKVIRGLHFRQYILQISFETLLVNRHLTFLDCCFCSNGEYDICLECVISGHTCSGNHKLHPTVNWPR
jgi:hypothetical protein